MKKLLIALIFMSTGTILSAQSQDDVLRNEGIVTYEEVTKLNIVLDGASADMQSMLPKENRNNTILYFNSETSKYQNLSSDENSDVVSEGGGGTIMVKMSQPDNIIFRDFKKNKIVSQKEFMTRLFLIESENTKCDWKITPNQKKILGYRCQEAIKQDSTTKTQLWFTSEIPVSTGPGNYANLPGLILMVNVDDGERTITAKSVEFKKLEDDLLARPKKGKKVSKEKFDEIVKEKTDDMNSGEGGGTVIMTISQ